MPRQMVEEFGGYQAPTSSIAICSHWPGDLAHTFDEALATGLRVLFFNVRIATSQSLIGMSTVSAFNAGVGRRHDGATTSRDGDEPATGW